MSEMAGHEWRRLPKLDWLRAFGSGRVSSSTANHVTSTPIDSKTPMKSWVCDRCGQVVVAIGMMSLADARKRGKVPFDCNEQLVRNLHDS